MLRRIPGIEETVLAAFKEAGDPGVIGISYACDDTGNAFTNRLVRVRGKRALQKLLEDSMVIAVSLERADRPANSIVLVAD